MSVIASASKVSRYKGAYGDEAREETPPQNQEDVGGDGGGTGCPCCLRRPDRSLPSPQRGALLGRKYGLSVGDGSGAGFRAWGGAYR